MNNCIHLKQKLNRTIYCKVKNKEIRLSECSCCEYREYKTRDYTKSLKSNSYQMKNKSNKLAKLERDRFSLFTDDLEHCIICGKRKNNLHEVFPGAFRLRSIKEHMVLPLCSLHHKQIHDDIELCLFWIRSCQKLFEKSRTRDEFIKIFGRSYL